MNISITPLGYQRAAAQGNATAQSALGVMYEVGQGVPQDYFLAYMWINIAASQPLPASDPNDFLSGMIRGAAIEGRKLDLETRDMLAARMTPRQIAEGQKLAREWKAKPER
jgi:uncharacterized protein